MISDEMKLRIVYSIAALAIGFSVATVSPTFILGLILGGITTSFVYLLLCLLISFPQELNEIKEKAEEEIE